MKRYLDTHPRLPFTALGMMAGLALPLPSLAASVALATAPLANARPLRCCPNLMFILDNSGSMGQDYTPDYMSSYNVSVANGAIRGQAIAGAQLATRKSARIAR